MTITIPGYTIVRKVGQGGSAEVYLAVQNNLNRRVALKVVKSALTADPKFGERFKREGRIIAQLNHPNIIPVYDIGEIDGDYYMAMEFLNGGDLRDRCEQLSLGDFIKAMQQVLSALAAAHAKGFVHRDIKPANILFRQNGDAVLTDFGIARQSESLTQMTVTGAVLGTPAYMSPEQIAGRNIGPATDLYAIGVTLFEMLAGYQPYRGESMMNVAMQQVNAAIPKLPKATAALQSLIESLLAKDPVVRATDANTLIESLNTFTKASSLDLSCPLKSLWVEAPPLDATVTYLTNSTGVRKQSLLGVGIGVVAAASLAGFGAWYYLGGDAPIDEPVDVVESSTEIPSPPVDPWRETLDRAEALIVRGQLIEPADENALTLYRQVLSNERENAEAISGEATVLRQLVSQVDDALTASNLELAQTQIARLQNLWPDERRVQQLSDRLVNERQKLEAQNAQIARNREISRLLQSAGTALLDNRLLQPEADSAYFYYNKVLALAPNNVNATSGLNDLQIRLLSQIQAATRNNEFDQADRLIVAVKQNFPNQPGLADLETALSRAKSSFQQQQALQLQITELNQRESTWRGSDSELAQLSQQGGTLLEEVNQLLAANPDSRELRNLQSSVTNRLDEIDTQLETESNKRKAPAIGF